MLSGINIKHIFSTETYFFGCREFVLTFFTPSLTNMLAILIISSEKKEHDTAADHNDVVIT